MNVQRIEPTPNPNAFKFLVDGALAPGDSRHYGDAASAAEDPIAVEMFGVTGVETLFFCENFVTVTMTADADWRAVAEEVTRILEKAEGQAPAPAAAPAPSTPAPEFEGGDTEMLQQINSILDDRVRPALANDGGGLEVLGLEGKTLHIRYQGACGSCPSSIQGTLVAIQSMLQSEVDEELVVIPG